MTAATWGNLLVLLALTCPAAVVLIVAMVRGYSVEVRLTRKPRGEHEQE